MTNEPFYCYFIRSGWRGRVDTPDAIGVKFLKTLDALTGIDPIFTSWKISDMRNMSLLSLATARPRIAGVIEDNVVRNDFDEPSPAYGYHAVARAGEFKHPRSVRFTADAGGKNSGGTNLEFGECYDVAPDLAIITYHLFKAALLAINAIWGAPWACAQAFRSGAVAVPMDLGGLPGSRIESVTQVPLDPTFPYSIFHIPWIAYLSEPFASGLRLSPETLGERTPDGGILMIATEDRLDPNNPEHVRRARIIAETMIACTGYQPGGLMRK